MSDATLRHLAEGTRALALRDPLAAAKALLKGLEDQTDGCRQIVLRYLTDEIKHSNPSPLASAPAGSGAPAAASPSSVAAGAAKTNLGDEVPSSPATEPAFRAEATATVAGRTFHRRHR